MAVLTTFSQGQITTGGTKGSGPSSSGQEIDPTNVFSVFGQITGASGEPISGVEVRVSCGMGTLHCTGKAQSQSDGQYRVKFGPGVLLGSMLPTRMGVGLQAATVFVHKPGYACADLGRAGDLAMTDLDQVEARRIKSYAGVVYPGKPYQLNFVLVPAATIKGRLIGAAGGLPEHIRLSVTGKLLPPSSSVLSAVKLEPDGTFQVSEVPVGKHWWFETDWGAPGDWKKARTEEFTLATTNEYQVVVTWTGEGDMKTEWPR